MLAYLHDFHDGCAKVTAAGLAKVEILELSGRGIGGLKPDDFAGLSALTELDLSRNALQALPAGVFADLTALTELTLSNNALRTLPAGVFADLAALTELDLSRNRLRTLSATVLGGLHAVTELDLWNNALDPIPFAAFEALPALTGLSLGGNPGYRTGVEVSPRALRIARGATGEYRLRLTSRPTRSPRRATVSVSSESAGVTAAPAAVTFTGENWFRAQTVTVRVDGSAAPGAATLSHAVSGYTVMPGPPAVTVEIAAAAGSAKTAGPRVAGVSVAPPGGRRELRRGRADRGDGALQRAGDGGRVRRHAVDRDRRGRCGAARALRAGLGHGVPGVRVHGEGGRRRGRRRAGGGERAVARRRHDPQRRRGGRGPRLRPCAGGDRGVGRGTGR